jgi:5-methylcytosine-specific restriction endonuclease McrA
MSPGSCIVLNASYEFMSINHWFDAWTLVCRGKATPLASYEQPIRSENLTVQAPAVVQLKYHVNLERRRQSFTCPSHKNIWVREGGKCAYCGKVISLRQTTKDHVHPRSKGGKDVLTNVVAACSACNSIKSNRTLQEVGMSFREGVEPRQLTDDEKLTVLMKTSQAVERRTWLNFLRREGLTLF